MELFFMTMTKHSVADGTHILIELILHSGRRIFSYVKMGAATVPRRSWLEGIIRQDWLG
jgi:hypothetical protein